MFGFVTGAFLPLSIVIDSFVVYGSSLGWHLCLLEFVEHSSRPFWHFKSGIVLIDLILYGTWSFLLTAFNILSCSVFCTFSFFILMYHGEFLLWSHCNHSQKGENEHVTRI